MHSTTHLHSVLLWLSNVVLCFHYLQIMPILVTRSAIKNKECRKEKNKEKRKRRPTPTICRTLFIVKLVTPQKVGTGKFCKRSM